MSTHSLKDLRAKLGSVVREVAYSGQEAIITDSGTEIAVLINMDDYERLHEHADVADALYLREKRASAYESMSMAEMLELLGVTDSRSVEPTTELMDALRVSVDRARPEKQQGATREAA